MATDLNSDMLDIAKQRINNEAVEFSTENAQDLSFADNSFDLAVCQFGLMFFPDKLKGAKEAFRVLRRGGRCFFSTWERLELQAVSTADLVSIIQGCKRNDRESQRLLYYRYYGFALKVVYRYVGDYSNAILLTNEAMLTVFRSVSGFKHLEQIELEQRTLRSFFERWMKNVLIRTAVGWLRSRYWIGGATVAHVHADADIWVPPVAGDVVDVQLYQSLITRLVSLPPPHRLVYNLYVIDGYPAREVAGLSCMRIKKMKCHLAEAGAMLRNSKLIFVQ